MRGEVDFVGRRGSRGRRSPALVGAGNPRCPAHARSSAAGTGRRVARIGGWRVAYKLESLLSQRIPARFGVGLAGARGWGRFQAGGGVAPPNACPFLPQVRDRLIVGRSPKGVLLA